jgi:DENN domain-containing protein 2
MMALLYPFTWQHIFVPVLPPSLLNFCCAPMPFVVGILRSSLPEVLEMPMDTGVLLILFYFNFIFFLL